MTARGRGVAVYFMAEYTSGLTGITWRRYADAAGNVVSIRVTGRMTRAQSRAKATAKLARRPR